MYHERLNLTIAALATSPGSSIGIIRISGNESFNIIKRLTNKKSFTHLKANIVKIINSDELLIEKCLLLPFFSPNSFTGEDVVELHVHGSSENAIDILNDIFILGAVPALNGEFSFRAVLNGKMTLNESLSLNSLISASNPLSVKLSRKAAFEDDLFKTLRAELDIWKNYHTLTTALIDFPDQIDDEIDIKILINYCDNLRAILADIVKNTVRYREALNFTVLILGRPNVGKSTLFNTLLKNNRAITSPIEGTTRDYISETLFINRFPVKLIDSAGIRESSSDIENEGVDKAKNLAGIANLVLTVFDSTAPFSEKDRAILVETEYVPRIIVFNKSDLASDSSFFNSLEKDKVKISCKTGAGLENLFNLIEQHINDLFPDTNNSLFFSDWQLTVAKNIISNIDQLKSELRGEQIELISQLIKYIFFDIRNLTGEISSFNIYEEIFGQFCLGK
jgi:tRNA modification GTPase